MRIGDTVLHKPTREKWTLAYVDEREVMWCGWPEGWAKRADCELIESCSDAEHWKLIEELARMGGPDARQRYAFAILEARREQECLAVMHL